MIGDRPGEDQNRRGKSNPNAIQRAGQVRVCEWVHKGKGGGVRNVNLYAHTRPMMCEGLHTWRKKFFPRYGIVAAAPE